MNFHCSIGFSFSIFHFSSVVKMQKRNWSGNPMKRRIRNANGWTCENLSSFCTNSVDILSFAIQKLHNVTTTHIILMPSHFSLCVNCAVCWRLRSLLGSHQHFISCAWHSHTVECSSAYWADDGFSSHVHCAYDPSAWKREKNICHCYQPLAARLLLLLIFFIIWRMVTRKK